MSTLLDILREERQAGRKGGIYHRTQVDMTYNSNHMEGSRLTHEQTRYIYETNTVGPGNGEGVNVDDIVETVNHFRCLDLVIDRADEPLDEPLVKELHLSLKASTSDSRKAWFRVGEYKSMPNEVGGHETCAPDQVGKAMRQLLADYHSRPIGLHEIMDFHYHFEAIHPFQDGNGRVGRLVMFKECLAHGVVPFIITDDLKFYYYRGLREWPAIPGYLADTCLTAQDRYKALLDYFKIDYPKVKEK